MDPEPRCAITGAPLQLVGLGVKGDNWTTLLGWGWGDARPGLSSAAGGG